MQVEQTLNLKDTPAVIELKEKVWRRSHSYKSVRMVDMSANAFERFLVAKKLRLDDALKAPIAVLDKFSAWLDLDEGATPSTVHSYVGGAKKIIKAFDVKIPEDEFRDKVTLPKKRPFADEKVTKPIMARIISGLKHFPLKTVLMLEKDTQIRPMEACLLRVSDFNLAYDPPYLNVAAEISKSDYPRELFFTPETKEFVIALIKQKNKKPDDFLFLGNVQDPMDEMQLQKLADDYTDCLRAAFRNLMEKPNFTDLNQVVTQRGKHTRYKIRIYSFKKFCFTAMADTLGEIAAKATKGDKDYALTYYRKSREERAEDYRKMIPKLSIFDTPEKYKLREQIQNDIKGLSDDQLAKLRELIQTVKA